MNDECFLSYFSVDLGKCLLDDRGSTRSCCASFDLRQTTLDKRTRTTAACDQVTEGGLAPHGLSACMPVPV
eukprot:scaffold119409_cov19-Tisochrysis_lutea.AAC.1